MYVRPSRHYNNTHVAFREKYDVILNFGQDKLLNSGKTSLRGKCDLEVELLKIIVVISPTLGFLGVIKRKCVLKYAP